jgi:predicted PurR-regulated permease PerM
VLGKSLAGRSAADVTAAVAHGSATLHRPLIVLAVCAVGAIGYLARDFLIPTAGAVVLALMLMPVANALERLRLPGTAAAALSVLLLAFLVAGLLALAIPQVSSWAEQGPYLTLTLEHKLAGLRKSFAFLQEISESIERATSAPPGPAAHAVEKVVVPSRSLLGELAGTTPGVVLQIAYAAVLAFMLLAHRDRHRVQVLRIPKGFGTRVRLARLMRDLNERVGYYLFSLATIYCGVAAVATLSLALIGLPNALMWGAFMGFASFVPFVGPPVVISVVTLVGLLTFYEWTRIASVPAVLLLIHFAESQFITPALVSRRCALNTVAVFFTIGLLGWMWGTIGAIVAVPLLILLSTIAGNLPSLRWLELLLADDRPVSARLQKPTLSGPLSRGPLSHWLAAK